MKNIFLKSILIFLLFNLKMSYAQIKTNSEDNQSYFKFGTSYLSNYVYNGRQDSLASPYITSTLGYFNKNGFNCGVTSYYLDRAKQRRFDFFSFDANYDYEVNDKLSFGASANRTYYNKASTAVKSDIKGSFGLNADYDFGFVELYIEPDLLFSKKTDFSLNVELLHDFVIEQDNGKFTLSPTFSTNLSTLNYYEGYLNKNQARKIVNSNANIKTVTSLTTVDNNHFTLMDYELSLPVQYESEKWVFFVTPTFVIPKNTIYTTTVTSTIFSNGKENIVTSNSTSGSELHLRNNFFIEVGLYFKLNR